MNLQLRRIYNSNKTIVANTSYLSILQLFSLLFPFITYPYVICIVGMEKYGTIIFASSIVAYLSLLINFGFNIIGARDVACYISDNQKVNQIVSSIYINKSLIWLFLLIVYVTTITTLPLSHDQYLIYLFSFFLTMNELLFPIWFFQAIEKMRYITFINISVRLLFVFAIFIFIKQPSDYVWIPLLNSIGAFIGGLVALYIVFWKEKVVFKLVELSKLKESFKLALPIFISSLSIQLYLYVNKIFIGAFLGMSEVTVYDLGEKISNLLRTPVGIISQAVFPKFSREKNISYINKVMFFNLGLVFFAFLLLLFIGKWVVLYFMGYEVEEAELTIYILSFAAVFATANVYLGGNRMIPLGYVNLYSKISVISCAFFLCYLFAIWLLDITTYYSIALNLLFTEVLVCIICLYFDKKLKILLPLKKI